jgi:hypothetical protein
MKISCLTLLCSFVSTSEGEIIDAATKPAWPDLPNTEPAQDTDSDGIPDAWESQNGLNPNDGKDANMHVAGYSHLEQYLSSLLPEIPAQDDPTQ